MRKIYGTFKKERVAFFCILITAILLANTVAQIGVMTDNLGFEGNNRTTYDNTSIVSSANEWHDDCSSTERWIYGDSWDGWIPWVFETGTLASDNGYLHCPSNDGWATGPMWYKELEESIALSQFTEFTADIEMLQPSSLSKGVFTLILYDELKQPILLLYAAEWTDAAKDIDLNVIFYPIAGGSEVHTRLNINTDFRGILSLYYNDGYGGDTPGLYAHIDGVSDILLLNRVEWQSEASQQIKYIGAAWRRGSGQYLDTRCYDILLVYSDDAVDMDNWDHQLTHVIDGSIAQGGDFNDYQVRIVLHYGSGTNMGENGYLGTATGPHCNPDFSDIRFVSEDMTKMFSYWCQEVHEEDYAIFWVKVSYDLRNDQTIRIFYGNPAAISESNGHDTFVFFDDFTDDTIDAHPDSTNWQTPVGESGSTNYVKVKYAPDDGNNKVLELRESGDGVSTYILNQELSLDSHCAVGWKWKRNTDQLLYATFYGTESAMISWRIYYDYDRNCPGSYTEYQWYNGQAYQYFSPMWEDNFVNEWWNTEWRLGQGMKVMNDDSLYTGGYRNSNTGYLEKFMIPFSHRYRAATYWCDDIYIRKYYDIEPTHGIWELEVSPEGPSIPVISNIEKVANGFDITLSWDVNWGTGATSRLVECFWSPDTNFVQDDVVYESSQGTNGVYHYSTDISQDEVLYSFNNYYFKIHAYAENNYGSEESETGIQSVLIKHYPTDDAYTSEEDYTGNYGDEIDLRTRDYQMYMFTSWLKFSIDSPENVRSASLHAYVSNIESNGHGTIRAYSTITSWNEDSITEGTAPLNGDWLADDTGGSIGSWDHWDVTDAAGTADIISIRLLCQSGMDEGATYYSKEFNDPQYRPYLTIEYWGAPQEPIMVSNNEANPFVDDHFGNPNLDTDTWSPHTYSAATEWDYQIVSGGSYYEDTRLKFYDNIIAQHNLWNGYYFDQENLDIRNAFCFETKVGWSLYQSDSPAVQIGVKLYDDQNGLIANIYFDYGGYWGDYAYIHGDIGTSSRDWSNYLKPPVATVPHDAMFEIERNLEGEIALTYWEVYDQYTRANPHEILVGTDTRSVAKVRLFCREKTPYDNAYTFGAWFDSIKETRTTTLRNPETDAPFANPIQQQSFSSELTEWQKPSGGAPIGNLISAVSIDGNAWHVNIDNDEWSMYQQLDGNRNDFRFAAIENQRVSFTFYAIRDNSDSKVCAMIKYTSPGDNEAKVVVGDWVYLSTDDSWEQVAVTTEWRLPPDIDTFEVWIIGEALPFNDFSAIIDESRLAIVENDNIDSDHCQHALYSVSCGTVSVNLATIYAYKPDGWNVKVIPIVLAQAAPGYVLKEINIDFAVSHGQAAIADNGAIEANNQEYMPVSYDPATWNEMAAFGKGIVKWGTRAVAFTATMLGAGIPGPLLWIFGDLAQMTVDIILKPRRRVGNMPIATPDNPGWMDTFYPSPERVSMGIAGLNLLWDMSSSYENPILSVVFTVEFESEGGVSAYRSVSTMAVTFPTS